MKTYNAVIWDLDGTLLDTLVDLRNSVNYAMAQFGYPECTMEQIRTFVGNGVKKLVELAIPNGTDNPNYSEAYDTFCAHYAIHNLDNTRPYDGVLEVIEELKARGVKQAIVSNKVDDGVKKLNDAFFGVDIALGVTDDLPRKPAPDMVHRAMDLIGAIPSETVYIGDSEVDMATAKNAGLPCISVLWGFRSREELEPHNPECMIEHPSEILEYIK